MTSGERPDVSTPSVGGAFRIRQLRKLPWAVAVLAVIVTSVYLLRPDMPPPAPPAPATEVHPVEPPTPAARPVRITTLPVASTAAILNSPDTTAGDDLATLELLLSQYRKILGGNPVGANDEIAAALLGRNAKGLAFLPAKGSFLDEAGQLVDRWGSPYFFHSLSADRMDITSAGPDRKLHTPDDLTHGL